jgi:hypothetical protein
MVESGGGAPPFVGHVSALARAANRAVAAVFRVMESRSVKAVFSVRVLVALVAMAAAACGESEPLSPAGPSADSSPNVTAPTAVSPAEGERVTSRQPTFTVSNPTGTFTDGTVLKVRFIVQDMGSNTLHRSDPVDLGSGSTSYTLPTELDHNREFRWFAEAVWHQSTGPASAGRAFMTPEAPAPAAPPPAADYCTGTPLQIVACQRARVPGRMSHSQLATFVRNVARNLTAAGSPGAPFGALRKAVGANCEGYSCDIVCAGQGDLQLQYDVLNDAEGAQLPVWRGPFTGRSIRTDVCEIQW